jgi:NADPH:quinone reductase
MRAVWYERTGSAEEVLICGEQPTPQPRAGEVRIKLAASGVNPADTNRRRGAGYVMDAPLVIPHSDGAGVVDAVGEGVVKDWLGARVWLYNGQRGRNLGTAAEYISLDGDLVTRLPHDVSFEVGACLGIPCMTAHRCVFSEGLVEGKTVLVTGGSGAVGNYAIQLAKWGGARVIATDTADRAEDARNAGADLVLDFRTDDLQARIAEETGGQGVDHIVEVDFGGNLPLLPHVVALNGSIASYASRSNTTPSLPFYPLLRKNVAIRLVLLPTTPHAARRRAQQDITRWLESGRRFHRIARQFPLAETAAAHQAVEAGGKRGTVIVTP